MRHLKNFIRTGTGVEMSEATEQWLEFSLTWVDEQLAAQKAGDELAWQRFRAALLPFD